MRLRAGGLRTRLIGLMLATLIPLVGLGGYWALSDSREERARLGREAQDMAELVASQAAQSVAAVQERLAVFARLPEIRAGNRQEVERLFQDLLPDAPHLQNLGLVASDGTMLASAVPLPPGRHVSLRDREWLQRVVRWGEPTVGGFQVGRITGNPNVILAHPVLDDQGRLKSIVFAALDLEYVSRAVTWVQPGIQLLWAVVDEQGLVLLHSRPEVTSGSPLGPLPGMLIGETVVAGTRWHCVVGMPEDMVTVRMRAALWRIGLPSGLVLLAAGGVALWLARDIWRPLQALTAAVRRIAGGDRDIRISVGGAGEVSEVATALREALGAVRAREADLARRNNELSALVGATRRIVSLVDLDQILQTIVEQATVISGTNFVRLLLLEKDAKQLRCRVGVGLPMEEQRDLVIPVGESFSGQVVATGKPLAVPDTRGDPRLYYPRHATQHSLISYLGLPVKLGDQVLGVLVFNTQTPRNYSDEEIAYLSAFADQAAIAIENARLHEAAVRRGAELESLLRANRTVMAGLDLPSILERIVAEAATIADTTHVRVMLLDREAGVLRIMAQLGKAPDDRALSLDSLSGLTVRTGEAVFCPDAGHDPRNPFAEWDRETGIVSHLSLPIKSRGEVLGVLTFNTAEPRQYGADDIMYLASFADQAAIAIENARLYGEIQQHADTLEARVRERTAELEDALRVKVEFLGKMSHELRTPLNFVLGFSELLQQRIGGPLTSKQANYVDRIQAGGRRLLSLVNDVLDLAQVDAGKSRLRLEPVILSPLIQEVMGLFQVQATQKRLKMTTVLDPWVPFIVADHFKLSQILQNLISNAVKFTPEDGSLRILTRHVPVGEDGVARGEAGSQGSSYSLELIVEDTGIGIAPENLETIFGAFYQVDGSEIRAYGGAGLGLTLVRKLVESHGGRVWAESAGLGQGSRFIVRLPRLGVPTTRRILLVEHEGVRDIPMAPVLENAGFIVVGAATGAEALTAMEATPFDLLVLDILPPGLDGWQILRRVREAEDIRTLPVLVLIGSESVNAEQALALGADEYLTRPVSPRVLVDTVVRLLAHSGVGSAGVGSCGKEPGECPGTGGVNNGVESKREAGCGWLGTGHPSP